MAAKDYIIVEGCLGGLYLAKKITLKKSSKREPPTMSEDRRPITESEMIGCFIHFLRDWCKRHGEDTVHIEDNGRLIFKATLLDKEGSGDG